MAERRMFALKIVDSDAFLDMPASTQNLYFHLSMRADDDGFISNAKKVMRMIGASDDDMKILLAKRFLLSFDTGIVVIKHWRLHNYIAKDRYTETIYKEEKEKLFVKANGSYTDHSELVSIPYTGCIQNDDTGKVSIGKVSEGKDNITPEIPAKKTVDKPYSQEFENFWDIYPKREGKKQAYKVFNALLKKGITQAVIHERLKTYKARIQSLNTGYEYIRNPSTFLNNLEDYASGYVPTRSEHFQKPVKDLSNGYVLPDSVYGGDLP